MSATRWPVWPIALAPISHAVIGLWALVPFASEIARLDGTPPLQLAILAIAIAGEVLLVLLVPAAFLWHPDRPRYMVSATRFTLHVGGAFATGGLLAGCVVIGGRNASLLAVPALLASAIWAGGLLFRLRLASTARLAEPEAPHFRDVPEDQDGVATPTRNPPRLHPTSQLEATAMDRTVALTWEDEHHNDKFGTAVLVHDDLILTSLHVASKCAGHDVRVLYKMADGHRETSLAAEPEVAKGKGRNDDWALLRLAQPLGMLAPAHGVDVARGWYRVHDEVPELEKGDALLVVGWPLSKQVGKAGEVYGFEDPLVHYTAWTRAGCSGGPCLAHGRLVGVHKRSNDQYSNTGVSLVSFVDHLRDHVPDDGT